MKTINQINPSSIQNTWSSTSSSDRLSSIVILDPTVPDSELLLQGIQPGTPTYILENSTDAVAQITQILY
jgi:Domain of unknown function (DUF4347)